MAAIEAGTGTNGYARRVGDARGVKISPADLKSEATGEIILDGDVPVIRAIEVRYRLSHTHEDDREKIERAHAVHHKACAVSRTVERSIEIRTPLELS